MERKGNKLSALIILVTYLVGIAGFSWTVSKPLFLWMVPFHLLLVFGLVMGQHKKWDITFGLFLALGYVITFSAEYIGVHTGWLFGNYRYGTVLGARITGIPLIIGVNWLLLSYCTYSISAQFLRNKWVIIVASSILLVSIDYLIEPVAIKLGFWEWEGNIIPLYNYLSWFGVALVVNYLSALFRIGTNFGLSCITFLSQAGFFLFLR